MREAQESILLSQYATWSYIEAYGIQPARSFSVRRQNANLKLFHSREVQRVQ